MKRQRVGATCQALHHPHSPLPQKRRPPLPGVGGLAPELDLLRIASLRDGLLALVQVVEVGLEVVSS